MIEIISFGMIAQAEAKPKKKSESSMVRCEICNSTKVTMVYTKPSQQKLVQVEWRGKEKKVWVQKLNF